MKSVVKNILSVKLVLMEAVELLCFFAGFLFFFSKKTIYIPAVLILALMYMTYRLVSDVRKPDRRAVFVSAAFSLIFAVMLTLGSLVEAPKYGSMTTVLKGVCALCRIPVFFTAILFVITTAPSGLSWTKKLTGWINGINRTAKRLFVFFLLCAVWGFMLIVCWPGLFSYDAPVQLLWYQTDIMTSHHPVLHTLLIGWCMDISQALTGAYKLGVTIYAVIQILILAFAVERAVVYVSGYSGTASVLLLLYLVFNPMHGVMAVTVTKDLLFLAFFILWTILIVEGCKKEKLDYKYIIQSIFVIFLMCAFRNNGIYVFVVSIPFTLVIMRKKWKGMLIITVASLAIWMLFTGPVYKALNIGEGKTCEKLSVPIQQLSRAYNDPDSGLSEETRESIEYYVPDVADYYEYSADATKNTFRNDRYADDSSAFWKLWLSVFKQCPKQYVVAFLKMSDGLWYPGAYFKKWGGTIINFSTQDMAWYCPTVEASPKFPALYQRLVHYFGDSYISFHPVISLIIDGGLFFWLLLLELAKTIHDKKWGLFLALVPSFLYWGTCILGPVALYRYTLPIIFVTAILSLPIFYEKND